MLIVWDWADKDACANNGSPSVIKHAAAGPDFRIDFISVSPNLLIAGTRDFRRVTLANNETRLKSRVPCAEW
jgi:hypothetical protein